MLRHLSQRLAALPASSTALTLQQLKNANIPSVWLDANCRLQMSTQPKDAAEKEKDSSEAKADKKAEKSVASDDLIETLRMLEDKNSALEKERTQLLETKKDLQDKYTRALAEVENVRRRGQRQLEDTKQYSIQGFCKDLLEVPDILDRAIASVSEGQTENDKNLKDLFEGVVMTHTVLLKTFKKHGLVKVDPLGEKFDPNLHEAMFQVPDPEKEAGTIAHVAKIGYSLHERPIRPAQVGVVAAPRS